MDIPASDYPILRLVLLSQGLYYLVTAIWPLVHMKSFLRVTGPKNDLWLVRTVGAMILVAAAQILSAQFAADDALGFFMVTSIGVIVALGAVDIVYVFKRVISPIYLADAALEGVLLFFLLLTFLARM